MSIPIQVEFDSQTPCWIAFDEVSTEYGVGETEAEAIADYEKSYAYHLEYLRVNRHRLGGPLLLEYHRLVEAGEIEV